MSSAEIPRVLIVDDQFAMAETLADGLVDRGFDAVAVSSGRDALVRLEKERFDALVTDLRMQGMDGLELLQASRKLDPQRPVIVMTAYGAIDTAVESIRRGASHYLTKPFKLDELVIFLQRTLDDVRVRREAAAFRFAARGPYAGAVMIGSSARMRAVFDTLDRVADTPAPVLITGETGTGKGMVALALHAKSRRAAGPFVTVNCTALPETLLESELFGHVKGAFTGATDARIGLVAEAHGGTLFLDEIGEMPLPLQAKLLHVLERQVVRPVGGSRERDVDVRIVAATHRDLRARVREGTFREDLLYRLEVVTFELPSLRERPDDVPALLEHFLQLARVKYPHSPVQRFAPDVLRRLLEHRWPGNVRELAHAVERVVLLGTAPEASLNDLPANWLHEESVMPFRFAGEIVPVRELQRRYAAWALEQLGGHRTRTADKLGIDGKTLAKWLADERD